MANRHPQAYLDATGLIAASPSLDPAHLSIPDPGGDALLAVESDGLGLVAARRAGPFTHVVAALDRPGIELWEAPHWRAEPDGEPEDLPALEPGPLDLPRALALLADAPPGVHAELLDAALAGPVTLVAEDPERRAAWIAWLTATVPGPLTFATFATRPLDVRVCATTAEHATAFTNPIHTDRPSIMAPSRYAEIATAVATRDPATLGEPDPVALAVRAGATDLLTPEELSRALEDIIALARAGDIGAAARAAAGLGERPLATTDLVLADPPGVALEVLEAPEPELEDAEVIEETEVGMSVSELEASLHPEPREETFEGGVSLDELIRREREP